MSAAPEPVQLDVFAPRQRAASRHEREIARLVPIAQELAIRAGASGLTVGDVRLVAEQRALIEPRPSGRQLSWLSAVMRRAGLQRTEEWRICPQPRTRNNQRVWRLRETQ